VSGRSPFGYVVSIEGSNVRLNLLDAHRGQVAGHRDGVSTVTEIGGLFGVDGGVRLLVLRVRSLSFAEPREAHSKGVASTTTTGEPLRHLEATVVGTIARNGDDLSFTPNSLVSPALGADAYPLSSQELGSVLKTEYRGGLAVNLGTDTRGGGALRCDLSQVLSRHVAVLGSTGQGKSCFTAAVLQQLVEFAGPRIVIFDINGEYEDALAPKLDRGVFRKTVLGGSSTESFKIPYYALGRHGLSRLLLPSDKTQRPALTFALECLNRVGYSTSKGGAGLKGSTVAQLFDDCRTGDATPAWNAIDSLRSGKAQGFDKWPHMLALGCLVAESQCLKRGKTGTPERDAFHYSNVAPLVTRIHRCVDDPLFTSVVSVGGGPPADAGKALDWVAEGSALCDHFFGSAGDSWKVHLIDLRSVAHDIMPLVLGSLLELLAFELFRRGQGATYPTLLVLEEAHHYLRQFSDAGEDNRNALAYERLAKEGRKFGLSLWLSTQRPSEISSTVLAQCGTWCVFRLTSEKDLAAVASASEWVDKQELTRIAGLPRQQALIFGSSVSMPVRVLAPVANPLPRSDDPDFSRWAKLPSGPSTPSA
jgi:uncharacterized protein